MITLQERIELDNIQSEAWTSDPPSGESFTGNWYKVVLRRGSARLATPFGMGSALDRKPTTKDVLESLLSEAYNADDSFERWCSGYGIDTEDTTSNEFRKARREYRQTQTQAEKLKRFLGNDFDAYLYETERL